MSALPGLRTSRLLGLVERSLSETRLDLAGARVLTEAATGSYAVTPILAALGGAGHVDAITRSTRFGSVADVTNETMLLAEAAGVADRISIHDHLDARLVGAADIVTNSGHVRPIDDRMVAWMQPGCVVPLMFEAWEIDLGRDDVDLTALDRRGIRYAGTNERHPAVDVFSFLGPMLVKLLNDAAVAVYRSRVLLVCDNPFKPYLERGLERSGADIVASTDAFDASQLTADLDAVVVATKPTASSALSTGDLHQIAARSPGALLAQYWGDISRDDCAQAGVPCVPVRDPGVGHMGVLPSAVGPEPIVRLQAGGLKVGSILRKPSGEWTDDDREYVDEC